MGLAVGEHLYAIFELAQEQVRLAQFARVPLRHVTARSAGFQRRQQSAGAQRGIAPAADHLLQLHREFDFADAACTQFEIVGKIPARDLGIDQRLHVAQTGQRGVIEIAAVDERPQGFEQAFAGRDVASDRACLDPGVTLPVAALALVVLLHRGERSRDRSGIAERPQAEVHARGDSVSGHLGQQAHEFARHPREEFAVVERTRAIRAAGFRVSQHQVHIRGKIELAAAQLAERKHHQCLGRAVGVARRAVARTCGLLGMTQRMCNQHFVQVAGPGQRVGHLVETVDVTEHQPHRFGAPEPSKSRDHVDVPATQRHGAHRSRGRIAQSFQARRRQQDGVGAQGIEGEIAGQQHAAHALTHAGVVVHRHPGGATACRQFAIAFGDQMLQCGRQR